ncbi:hypothetical protein VTN00DRAFT_4479 [Thermoascus crustaceus]|uniref:uncharacterized protein n=1 Tax=Thermoascus crustaceus TaxID=5088 RepID=UPI00374279E1
MAMQYQRNNILDNSVREGVSVHLELSLFEEDVFFTEQKLSQPSNITGAIMRIACASLTFCLELVKKEHPYQNLRKIK